MTMPHWIAAAWMIGAFVTPIVLVLGMLWLRRAFVTGAEHRTVVKSVEVERRRITSVHEDVHRLSDRMIGIEGRVDALEDQNGEPPSRMELSKDIGKLAERVRGLETGVDAVKRNGETTNSYLHTLIEQGLRK